MKTIKFLLLFVTLNIGMWLLVKGQESNPDQIRQKVESQNFAFSAQTAHPQGGGARQLSPEYDLIVSKSSIISYLPYFGRAYTAPTDPSDTGIKFTSTNFEYKMTNKSESWEIEIKPKDTRDVRQMFLVIFNNGKASLNVVALNRQGISFDGYIK